MDEGVWVEYDEEVSFKIRYLSPETTRKIRKSFLKSKYRRHEKVEEIDEDGFNDALINHMIIDWKGIEFDGKPAKCDIINKKMLVDLYGDVGIFVIEHSSDHNDFFKKNEATALKN